MIEKLANIERRYAEIESLLADPEVVTDHTKVEVLSKELASLRELASLARDYREVSGEIEDSREIAREETDRELVALATEEIAQLEVSKGELEDVVRKALIPKDPNSGKNVILEIRAGAGGVEAGLFAADLLKMYSRYAQNTGWKIEVMSSTETEQGSIKEVVVRIKGKEAYSLLKHESGTHRVQRVPLTESSGRVHTSAATVAVLPEAEEVDVRISQDDLKIDIFHSSGHGGQNVQKVATAVRITYLPTGLVAICQDERSQHKNREKAMAVLRTRVHAQEVERQQLEISESRRSQVGSGDRSEKVRTYNFPQDRATDHRISLTLHNIAEVLEGNVGPLVDALAAEEQERALAGVAS